MILCFRGMIACSLVAVLLAGGWFAAVGLTLTSPQRSAAAQLDVFYVAPEGGPSHKPGCPYVDWSRSDLIRLAGPQAVEAAGCGVCEHCASGQVRLSRSP